MLVSKDGEANALSRNSHINLNAVCLGSTVSSKFVSSDVQKTKSENIFAKNGF